MSKKKDKFTEAYDNYYPVVFSVIYTKVDDVHDAKDICQEVFLKFFEKFDEIENYRKWLFGALRLSVFDFYRKKNKGKGNVDIDEIFSDVSLTFVNGFRDARIIISETFEKVENFSSEDKTLFDLVAYHNFSYSQTAKQMGLTKRKVEYRYRRIVNEILDILKKKGIDNIEDLL